MKENDKSCGMIVHLYRKFRIKKENNRGISLVELIIVLTIIIVVTVSAFLGISILNSSDASKTSKEIQGQLSTLREKSLSVKGVWSMELFNDYGQLWLYIYQDSTVVEKTKLGSRIELSYHERGVSKSDLNSGDKLIILFNKGSGSVSDVKIFSGLSHENLLTKSDESMATSIMNTANQYFTLFVKRKNSAADADSGSGSDSDVNLAYTTGKVVTGNLEKLLE